MLQKMLHGLQVPGYAADQQKKVAYFPSPAVASDCMKSRHVNMRCIDNKSCNYHLQKLLIVQEDSVLQTQRFES